MAVEPIPARYGSVTANLVVDGGASALDFYERAFGAVVETRLVGPGGMIMHSEIRIGDTLLPSSRRDPFGHRWTVGTHTEDMSEAEMQRRMEERLASAAG